MSRRHRLLVVDPDRDLAAELVDAFERAEITAVAVDGLDEARAHLASGVPDALLVADELPDGAGSRLFEIETLAESGCAFFLMARDPAIHAIVEAMRLGAVDVIEKPLFAGHAVALVRRELERRRSSRRRPETPSARAPELARPPIIGRSAVLTRLLEALEPITQAPRATVLVEGESGTGKELIARAIHHDGPRRDRPFLAINCATLTENLLEAELFGYEKGAFTGALDSGKKGLFEAAAGGTLFLDEIGELEGGLQAKLLRVLQEGAFKRVGGVADVRVDVRIIAATNRDLRAEVDEGRFRADLYYRLAVVPVRVPALRERLEDVEDLSRHFVANFAGELGKSIEGISSAALEALRGYSWPGNVRELRNICEYAAIVCDGEVIEPRHLTIPRDEAAARGEAPGIPLRDRSLRAMESELIRVVLSETSFNVTRAAGILGINRSTLYNKMRDYGLQRDERPKMLQSV